MRYDIQMCILSVGEKEYKLLRENKLKKLL